MFRRMHFCALFFLCVITTTSLAWATPPIPKSKTEALQAFKDRLKSEQSKQADLASKVKDIDEALSDTKSRLIALAKDIQANEASFVELEKRIANLEIKKSVIDDQLLADRASISRLIVALERIRRTPPEAMIARPDSPYKTAQSAMLMGSIIPSINRHAAKLSKNIETLNNVKSELEKEKSELQETSRSYKKQKEELTALITTRKQLYQRANNDLRAREITVEKLSLQAKNLEDLLSKIRKEESDRREELKKRNIAIKAAKAMPKTLGNARLPLSGIIRTTYNQKDQLGAKSKGISIEGRAGAIVIAPMNGKVQFTGAFKRFGNVVIIEHAQGYHSLVANLDVINVHIGDIIKSGEPIGLLPNSSLIPRPTLYYELRKNGAAINPAEKFSGLG